MPSSRPSYLSKEGLEALAYERDVVGNSLTLPEFKETTKQIAAAEHGEAGLNPEAVKDPSPSSVRSYAKDLEMGTIILTRFSASAI